MKYYPIIKTLYLTVISLSITTLVTAQCIEGFYSFSGNANDASSNGYDGTVSGAQLTTGHTNDFNGAYAFDGVDDYIDLPVNFDYEERTINVWFNAQTFPASGNPGHIYNCDNPGVQYGNTILSVLSEGGQNKLRYLGGGVVQNVYDHIINANQWYMATIVVSDTDTRYYLDCELLATYNNFTNASNSGVLHAVVGNNRSYVAPFDGAISELRAYDCAMPVDSICQWISDTASMNVSCLEGKYSFSGNANDASSNGYDGTVSGAQLTTGHNNDFHGAYAFDGVDDYIDLPVNFDYEERTINVWFNAQTFPASGNPGHIYNCDNPGVQYGNTILSVLSEGGQNKLRYLGGGVVQNVYDHTINANQWYMATIVVSDTDTRYYLDCELLATYNNFTNASNSGVLHAVVGNNRSYVAPFDGAISELRAYDCAMPVDSICGWASDTADSNLIKSIQPMGVDLAENVRVVVNPVKSTLILAFSEPTNQPCSLQLFNTAGSLVSTHAIMSNSSSAIQLGELPGGMYFFQVSLKHSGEKLGIGKFIVE